MAKSEQIYYYQPYFWGGISNLISDGLKKYRFWWGEDLDIFSNKNYIQPAISFSKVNIEGFTKPTGFAVSSTGKLYVLGEDSTPKAVVYYKATPSGATPSAWISLFTSENAPATQGYSPITAFQTTEAGVIKEYLYYHTTEGTSYRLSRYGNINADSPTETKAFGTLTGLNSTDRLGHLVHGGELFILNGNYIARVSSVGNFINTSFTLPKNLRGVDIIPMVLTTGGDYLAILCKDTMDSNQSWIVIWDMVATSGAIAKIRVPIGDPQWITKIGSTYLVSGVTPQGKLEIYPVTGLICADTPLYVIDNVPVVSRPVSPPNSKTTIGSIFHFGLERTTKSGIYSIGEIIEELPALVMSHRFHSTSYAKHRPIALISIKDALYTAYYDDNDQSYNLAISNGSAPTYSSSAVLETILLGGNNIYTDKSWELLQVGLNSLPTGCSIAIKGRIEQSDTYQDINATASSVSIVGTKTQDIAIEGLSGRTLQLQFTFTSSGATCPQLKWIAIKGSVNYLN